MFELVMGYALIGIALLGPVLLLAGIVWVLVKPISLDDVERRHRAAGGAGGGAPAEAEAEGGSKGDRPTGPRRAA